MIIGTVYALVLGSFDPKKSVQLVTMQNLKQSLLPHWHKGTKLDLIIYDKCSESILLKNNEPIEEVEVDLNLNIFQKIKVYKLDAYGGKREVSFSPIPIDKKLHKVCFQYTIFPNGSSSSYMVKSGKSFYTFFPYFQPTYITTTLDDAMDEYLKTEYTKIEIRDE